MANSDVQIGRLTRADLAGAEALVAEAGWNQIAADWRMFLNFGTAYTVSAQGRVIATAAWIPYGACAWISMVLVTAAHRRRGLATRLLHRCIADVTAAGPGAGARRDAGRAGRLSTAWIQGGVGIRAARCRSCEPPAISRASGDCRADQ